MATHQVRDEFLAIWDTKELLGNEVFHIRLAVIDADHRPATAFWEKALEEVRRTNAPFHTVRITAVITKDFKSRGARKRLRGFEPWSDPGRMGICAADNVYWELLDDRRLGRLRLVGFWMSQWPQAWRQDWKQFLPAEAWKGARERYLACGRRVRCEGSGRGGG